MRSEAGVSERRACGPIGIHRGTHRYVPRPEDPRLRVRLCELAAERRRFGYRRLTRMLMREGWKVNHKRVYRLYLKERLSLRRRRGRRRRAGSRLVLPPRPTRPDQLWTMDFASDASTSGRRFRALNLMDGFTREALEIEPDTSLPLARVVRVLERLQQAGTQAGGDRDRRRAGVHQPDSGSVGLGKQSAPALHHAGQADGERLYRELQRQVPRRVPERELVLRSRRRATHHRRVEMGLQPRSTTLSAGIPNTHGVRSIVESGFRHQWCGARDLTPAPCPTPPSPLRNTCGANKTRRKSHYPWYKNGGQVTAKSPMCVSRLFFDTLRSQLSSRKASSNRRKTTAVGFQSPCIALAPASP